MKSLEITKKNGNVAFNESEHKYWNLVDPLKSYTSVTTMIHSFSQPFDKEFWSGYKAIQKLLGEEAFKMEKGGLLSRMKIDYKLLGSIYDFTEYDYNKVRQIILDDWQKKNEDSCIRGTAIHSELENLSYNDTNSSIKKFGLGGPFLCKKNYCELDLEKGVYPEYLIYDDQDDLAGQVDLLIKDGNDIIIVDFKTNKEINETSGFDFKTKKKVMMQYPLTKVMDCNLMHYTLQLSTYAYMIQKIHPEFNIKRLIIEHHAHDGSISTRDVKYMKSEVQSMIKFYKSRKDLETRREKRKPITF